MGITNIHLLTEPDNYQNQVYQAYLHELAQAHREGKHDWGSMRRDCPLCQTS